ncbi:sugar phosphate isomerase/epimerase [Treponema parvum]|uniref:Sugar phosphate isomerase/epimerase n=1 Tax=Treponema parvum TaxID=138851 RepID=A0A975IEX1_9SPIR|nr:sugar phosphate isomerase/epimerase family protein [Treponema parvum]QTQ14277.1 sugar phosphate isomerase/epimerase [Treponema parvum]
MKLSTENGELRVRLGDRKTIEMLSKVGFDAIDYGFSPWLERGEMIWNTDRYAEYAKEVNMIAKDNGIYFNQAHGPFVFDTSLFPDYSKQVIPLFKRCFEVCALLNIPHMVVHPIHHLPYKGNEDLLWKINNDFYRMLLPFSKETGVKIALENMYQYDGKRGVLTTDVFAVPEKYAEFYDQLNDPHFICLVDTGHCGIVGETTERMLRVMGKRIKALHLNDNLFRTDDHIIPGHGLMNLDQVMRTLAEIDYEGDVTFEVLNIYRAYDDSFLETSARYLHDVGRYIIAKIEGYKNAKKTNKDNR